MAKKQNLNPNDDNFGEDVETAVAASPKAGGINKTAYLKEAAEYARLVSKKDDAVSPIRTFFKNFDEKGGHGQAHKFVENLCNMEDLKGQDLWRTICQYLEWRGFFDQADMLNALPGDPAAKKVAPPPPSIPAAKFATAAH